MGISCIAHLQGCMAVQFACTTLNAFLGILLHPSTLFLFHLSCVWPITCLVGAMVNSLNFLTGALLVLGSPRILYVT